MSQQHAYVDLSPAQLDIYLDQIIHQHIPMYNIGGYVVLPEAVDADAFARAYSRELARHDAMRLRFRVVDGKPRQYVDEGSVPALEFLDFSTEAEPAAAARAWLDQAFGRNFQLDGAPLHSCALVKLGARTYWYCSVAHHLVIDGWGFGLWVRRLVASYLAETGRGERPAAPPATFLESVAEGRQRSLARRAAGQRCADAWPESLLEPRSGDCRQQGSVRGVRDVAPSRVQALTAFANAHGYELHHLLLALVYAYFSSLTGRERWAIGLPTYNRRGNEKLLVGSYVSVNPCVLDAGGADGIAALMAMAKRAMKEGVRQQGLSMLDRVQSTSADGARPGRLFDVQFNYMKLDYETDNAALRTTTRYLPNRWAQVPFSLNVCDFGSQQPIQLQIDANEAWFDGLEAELIFDRLDFIADQFMREPAASFKTLGLVSAMERLQLTQDWGKGAPMPATAGDIGQCFAAACARAPGAIALRCGGQAITYADLLARACALAAWLRQAAPDGGAPLAICMASSPNAIVSMIAAVLLRRPYVPLDPGYPMARQKRVLADARAGVLLTDREGPFHDGSFTGLVVDLDDPMTVRAIAQTGCDAAALCAVHPADAPSRTAAWIIYTSGSTGTPKGVVVPHSAILRLAYAPDFVTLDAGTVMLQAASLAFDAATFEIWATLLNGGTLVLPPQRSLDLDTLSRVIEEYGVNTMWLTAGLFDRWITRLAQVPRSLRYVLAGGDVVPPAAVHKLLRLGPDITFVNGYGPTENGVFSTCAVVKGPCDPRQPLPIGRPVNGSTAYVVGDHGQLLPFGAAGELWVGGYGLARGYLHQEASGAGKFIDSAGPDIRGRIYRTGDRVRWRADGQLDYLGRIDQQVKIRGYRIEVEEIENCLRDQPGVAEAVVVAVGTGAGAKQLRACVRPNGQHAEGALGRQLRRELGKVLPAYMVPAQFVLLDAIPLNANGKVDRGALRQLQVDEPKPGPAAAPATQAEAAILRLWASLLTPPPASVDSNFFEHGGNSLDAMQLAAELGDEFGVAVPVADLLARPTIREQAALLEQCLDARRDAGHEAESAIRRSAPMASMPMSFVQRQMWLSHQLNGGSHEYNVPGVFRVRGQLDRAALQASFERVIARHQPLACLVVDDGNAAVLRAAGPALFQLSYCDLGALPAQERQAGAARLAAAERRRSFDLERELPVRATVVRLDDDDYLLLVTFHHIAVDGWSLDNFQSELAACYRACTGAGEARLPELALGYQDYATHQLGNREAEASAAAIRHWRRHLEGAPAMHELPLDRPRGERTSYRGRTLRALLDQEGLAALTRLAAAERVSLYVLLQAAFSIVVGEYSQQRDVLVGTPVSGRHDKRLYPLIGCFINTVVTRTRYTPEQTLRDVVAANYRDWCAHIEHHALPFPQVLDALAPAQSRAVNPLFQLWFVLHEQAPGRLDLAGLDVELVRGLEANTKFDLMVSAAPAAHGLQLEWLYAEDLFAEAGMARMLDAYLALLRRLPALMSTQLRALPRELGLAGGAQLTPPGQRGDTTQSMADWVFGHAASTPAAAALRHGDAGLSYAQLAEKIRRLGALLSESGVTAGACVAVVADRTIGGVVAMAAIQSLGAACLPLDGKLPAERLNFMLGDAEACMLLGYSDTLQGIAAPQVDLLLLDGVNDDGWLAGYAAPAPAPAQLSGDAVAYLIYTSGSSGMPKGVRVTRANLVHYVCAMTERYGFEGCRQYAVNSAFHTDLGNTTLYLGLRHGACLHLMDSRQMLDGGAVSRYVHEEGIDVMKITPGHFRALCDDEFYPAPVPRAFLIFGGEVLRKDVLDAIAPACLERGCRLVNHYGPTETTIGCLTHEIDLRDIPDIAPLGAPLPGVSVRVMAEGGDVPRGAWGELVVGGPTVSLGYNKREELNGKVFSAAPDAGGHPVRQYRTGDRVRVNGAGLFEFGGRFDDQIKIRGFRIELAEIDTTLLRQPGVEQAVTIVAKDDARQETLVSFVVAQHFDAAAMSAALRQTLPDYMVPRVVIGVQQIPLLGNGKPDRQTLAAQVVDAAAAATEAPSTASEIALHAIVGALLRKDGLSIDQRFFDAGGNSLLVTRLANEVQLQLGVRIPVRLLMENHSIRTLAALVDALDGSTTPQGDRQNTVEIEI
jgi:amino acid adenylation domain-containing protein